ncbi:MAG: two-component regulator propeller domain-containing protein, partial [Anaerolineales bacterium]
MPGTLRLTFQRHLSSIMLLLLLMVIGACAGPGRQGQLQSLPDSLPASIASTTLDPATQRTPPTADAKFNRLSLDNGLSQSTVTCILQDDYGFIWLGTLDGLNKYDGHQFIVYRHDPDRQDSLSGNTINAIIKDRQGQLWIGTNNGLNRYDRSTDGFLRFQNDPRSVYSLSSNDVTSIFEDSNGTLWVGTTSGLNRYDPQRRRFMRYKHDPAQPESLIDDRVQAMAEYPVGTIWIGTPEGLDEFNPSQMTFQHYQFDLIDRFSLSNPDVRDLLVIGDQLWVATYGGGLNLWIPQFKRF